MCPAPRFATRLYRNYGLLIVTRPAIAWNRVAVLISVAAYRHFAQNKSNKIFTFDGRDFW